MEARVYRERYVRGWGGRGRSGPLRAGSGRRAARVPRSRSADTSGSRVRARSPPAAARARSWGRTRTRPREMSRYRHWRRLLLHIRSPLQRRCSGQDSCASRATAAATCSSARRAARTGPRYPAVEGTQEVDQTSMTSHSLNKACDSVPVARAIGQFL